jgi:hypothetical protein
MALSSKNLYTRLCASCHQPLADSDVAKISMSNILENDLEASIVTLGDVSPGNGKGKPSADAEACAE